MNTEPLAPDVDFILQGKEEQFHAGLNVLQRLTKGKVYLCARQGSQSKALTQARDVETHYFAGPHPAGNVSTHIHYLDPIRKGEHVWYVEAQDVLARRFFIFRRRLFARACRGRYRRRGRPQVLRQNDSGRPGFFIIRGKRS